MRDAMAELGGDPARVNPLVPADLVIDHSVQVDRFGTADAFAFNVAREYERNGERYQLLRWAQRAFRGLRVVPPGTGIVHQVNLEFLATVVTTAEVDGGPVAFPDTLVGTDSHTTMVNALGVLGYGVGGIEAEAVLLGQPLYQPLPRVVGVRLSGELPRGATATDLVLVVTERLRKLGVVGSFVEFAGDGLAGLALADRATISNMSPEFGATDDALPDRRRDAGLPAPHRARGRPRRPRRALRQGAGPLARAGLGPGVRRRRRARPRDRGAQPRRPAPPPGPRAARRRPGPASRPPTRGSSRQPTSPAAPGAVRNGSVVIAAITSCTNTSNPTVMVGAGLLARNAVARGPARPVDRQDVAGPRLQGRDRLPGAGRPHRPPRDPRLRPGRLRLHDLHRQLGPARRGGRPPDRGRGPRRDGRPLGQPQLRGPHPPAGPGQLPRLATARRRLRPRRADRPRPLARAAGDRRRRPPGLPRRPLAHGGGDPRRRSRARSTASSSGPPTPRSSRATSAGGRCRSPRATATPGTRRRRTWPCPPFFAGMGLEPAPVDGHRRARGSSPGSATR